MPADERAPRAGIVRALVDEAVRRSSILWLRYGDEDRARPAWHIWREGAVYVVADAGATGPGPAGDGQGGASDGEREDGVGNTRTGATSEQLLPGLGDATSATVTCRAQESRARLVTWQATVRRLIPRSPEWEAAAVALRAERLNATDAATVIDRWAAEAVIVRMDPTGEVLESP